MKKDRFIQPIQHEKESFRQFIFVTIFLAVGVGFFTTSLLTQIEIVKYSRIFFIVGCILIITALIFQLVHAISKLKKAVTFSGFVVFRNEPKELITVSRYKISEDMNKYLRAAFAENKAMETNWQKEPISRLNDGRIIGGANHANPSSSMKSVFVTAETIEDMDSTILYPLFYELFEYCIIEKLSLHLSSYFNNSGLSEIVKLSRVDIPDVLLENRFIRLFSEDMQNRELFSKQIHFDDETAGKGNIVFAYHPSGAVYQEFDLLLPKRSKMKRINKNQISIETSLFCLLISLKYDGYGEVLPQGFERFYMGFTDFSKQQSYKIETEISIKFKIKSLFIRNKWCYYNWADDFIDIIDGYMSSDTFFERINWNTTYTVIRSLEVSGKLRDQKNEIERNKHN